MRPLGEAGNEILLRREMVTKGSPRLAAIARLNSRQQCRSHRFIYMNGVAQRASEQVQPTPSIVAARSVTSRSIRSRGRANRRSQISQKGHIMFRKVAIALVAASVLTAPALAQNVQADTGKAPQTTTAPAPIVKADKAITKHRTVTRHHRHGVKVVKHAKYGKYAHHMKHGRTAAKQVSGKAVPVKQVSTKPAPKSGVN